MGLANLVCDLGATRLGICSEPRCDNVFVDTSPNQSRRYCSDRCSSRANVAAFRRTPEGGRQDGPARVNDGPLIVQSDKTLLLEVDHPSARRGAQGDRPLRRARALARAHPHLPPHPARPLERPGRRPRRRAGRRRAADVEPLRRPARAAGRRRRDHGPLRPAAAREAPGPRPGALLHRPAGPRGGAAGQEDRRHGRRPARRRHRRGPPERARQPQAGAAQARLARRGLRRLRRRRGARDRPRRGGLDAAALPARGRRVLLGRRVRASSCSPAAPARPSSARPRWRTRRRPRSSSSPTPSARGSGRTSWSSARR